MLEWLLATTENGGEGRIASGEWSNDKNVGVAISHDGKNGGQVGSRQIGRSAKRQRV